jgi:acetylornithine deacetylase
VDPIRAAAAVISRLDQLEAQLIDEARQAPEFGWTDRPCQVTVGHISGGEWLGSTAQRCEMAGSVGTLPWQDLPAVEARLIQLTQSVEVPGMEFDWNFNSGLRNHAYVSTELGVLQGLADLSRNGRERRIWNVSCDARHYHRVLGIPTVIFGAGSLAHAHARDEGVSLQEVQAGVEMFVDWLGGASGP